MEKLLRERVEALLIDTPNVVVLGDFNSEVDEAVHEYLRELGFVNAMEQVEGHSSDHGYGRYSDALY